ncbi:MAG: family 65 glycosyl hydrolase [Defluviitaleaceae bacterium]|nr:family 65 glycosyl hydrolase [Defluviitaleaceae bacterium]
MRKYADKYFGTDPWRITEDGFNPAYGAVAESIFSLGNEHMGLRGYFDEGYSGEGLQGCYVNGVYERSQARPSGYKGIPETMEFMVNSVDWVHTGITANGRTLDLAKSRFSRFSRVLDMRTGELRREFIWHADDETDIKLSFTRFLSMRRLELGASRIRWDVLKGTAEINVCPGLVFTREDIWDIIINDKQGDTLTVKGVTKTTKQPLYASAWFDSGKKDELTRIVRVSKIDGGSPRELKGFSYDELLEENRRWWAKQWELSDIEIGGGAEDQQGIRYCIFQMHQTLHSGKDRVVIGAKGLTGEVYNGNTFWDTEIYCLPFYLFTNPEAALGVLKFRYETLGEAKKRAGEMDLEGAFYPIATIGGSECCTLWQHANMQLQASTAVAYALWHHARVTGDGAFLREKGITMLEEICRMLASRGGFDPVTGEYGYYGVMGPDEFQLMVNHNLYTNYMAKKTFEFTLETLEAMGIPETAEHRDWRHKAELTRAGFDPETLLFEQHDGYFGLPHVDLKSIPVEDFPLYHNWSYDRIYRNDLIKQPDVLMFMFMYAGEFGQEQLAANFDYYEPRCIHESSLSPSVHSVLAARLGRIEQAYGFFKFASRLDLDNYNRNTNEGLHTTSIAGSWMNIVYGFGGLRSDGGTLSLSPVLPECWESLRFKLIYRGSVLRVEITRGGTTARLESGNPVKIKLYGDDYECLAD